MKRLSKLIGRKSGGVHAEDPSETGPDVRRSTEKLSPAQSLRRRSRNYNEHVGERGSSNEFKGSGTSIFGGSELDETTKLIMDTKKGIMTVAELLEELMSLTSIVSDEALFNLNVFLSDESVLKVSGGKWQGD
mmetsp:Transcript_933/g.1457  ORF Transcript_933/g.1457 Transcript_933/m.1457 type:complete len:133 (-) Transcript_933:1915-2313(-)